MTQAGLGGHDMNTNETVIFYLALVGLALVATSPIWASTLATI
jgi:hypothetical protein